MDRKLHLLDSYSARGSDGSTYKVLAYEHLVRDPSIWRDGFDHWEPTGQTEFRLEDGRAVEITRDGAMQLRESGVVLEKAT